MKTVCFAEDDSEIRGYLEVALKCQGYSVDANENGEELLASLRSRAADVSAVLLDVRMPRKNGIETLREIREFHPDLPIIMISAASSPINVVEAMRQGATDFLGKPFTQKDLHDTLHRAISAREKAANSVDDIPADDPKPARRNSRVSGGFTSASPAMRQIESIIDAVASSEASVLIQGETGVGKEVLARSLHERSARAGKPFVKLNCAALPSELVESELFGYERGAFTGAFQRKVGMFERADGGTLLLDEIGDMDYKLQAKLLQVLQDQAFQRLGAKETVHVDVRVICATHCDLESAIEAGTFRQDLFYRLNVISLRVPALRERKEDILGLAEVLLLKHANAGTPMPVLTASLKQALLAHDWPGNVRELENVIRRLIVLQNPEAIAAELRLQAARRMQSLGATNLEPATIQRPILEQVTHAKHQAETEAILAALDATHWNRKQAAEMLKTDYKALLYKIKKLGLEESVIS